MDNAIMVIAPYWDNGTGTWVFDDETVGLVKEPFVEGIPQMILAQRKFDTYFHGTAQKKYTLRSKYRLSRNQYGL